MTEVKTTPPLDKVLKKLTVDSRLKTCVIRIDKIEDAQALLDTYNSSAVGSLNRPLSRSQYKLYANEMLRGKWQLNGEPFIFGIDDSTGIESAISLQHRLNGLIEAIELYEKDPNAAETYPDAQLHLEVAVVYNVPIETADTVDQGMIRKHAHVLFRDEWVNTVIPADWAKNDSRKAKWCNVLAGAARLVWLRSGGATVSSAPKFVVSEMLDFIKEDHKQLHQFVSAILTASEEEGAGLKISLPYIAGLCYVASLDGDGKLHKETTNIVLDAMLKISQNAVTPGTAEHALVTYWNKLFSTPGSKDRDIDTVGPFVKALNSIIAGEKITAGKLSLSKKEAENYTSQPPLLAGYDEACFIYAAELKSEMLEQAALNKEKAEADRQAAREAKAAEKAEKDAAKAEEKALKDAEKAAAKEEADAAKEAVPVKPGVMAALAKTSKNPVHKDMPTKPVIKRRPKAATKA